MGLIRLSLLRGDVPNKTSAARVFPGTETEKDPVRSRFVGDITPGQ